MQARLSELTPREAQYVDAVRRLWAPEQSMEQRERAYSTAMQVHGAPRHACV